MKININAYTASITGFYDMAMGSMMAFAMVYLVANGMDEWMVGNLIALANVLAVITQPILANLLDRSQRLSIYQVIVGIILPVLLSMAGILLTKGYLQWLFLFYMLAMAGMVVLIPLHNSVIMSLMNRGYPINFGLTRSAGSISFGITTSIVGVLVTRLGTDAIIYVGMLGMLIYLIANTVVYRKFDRGDVALAQEAEEIIIEGAEENNFRAFFRRYPDFAWVLFGSLVLFIGHQIINTFMFQIVERLGGGSEEMGFAVSLGALVEAPSMIFYSKLNQRYSHSQALMASSIFFTVKTALTFFAFSMWGLYFAQTFQAGAFALYYVAAVQYTNEQMGERDKVKGQSYLTMVQTLAGIIGASLGGWLVQEYSIQVALFISLILSFIGIMAYNRGLRQNKVLLEDLK